MPDRAPEPKMRVRLLGDPALLPAEGGTVALERRAAALLALVTLEPGITRQRAALLLWPDSSDPRRNLRQQLLRFKQSFGHDLVDAGHQLALMPGVLHDLDSDSPATLLGEGDGIAGDDFDAWLAVQRRARRTRLSDAARARLALAEKETDLDAARAAAEALLAADPDNEAHHRELIRVHYLRNEADQALAAFARLRDRLQRELGAQPDAQTQALLRLVHQSRTATSGMSDTPLGPVALQRPPVLAGREAELRLLLDHMQQHATLLLLGEAGMGKTRLLEAAALQQPAAAVLSVAARPGDRNVPYALATRWLRELASRTPQPPDARTRAALAHLLPEWGSFAGPLPGGAAARLHAAALRLLDDATRNGLAAVLLDDLHYADGASIELLQGLPGGPACAWLLALRPGEGDPALQAWVLALQQAASTHTLRLPALDVEAVGRLVASVGAAPWADPDLAGKLHRHTGGNPLFVLETLKSMAGRGTSVSALPAAPTVLRLIQLRLTRLSAAALQVARCMAVLGQDASPTLVARVLGQRPLQLADAWAELEAAQVLRGERFAHDLIAQAARDTLPDAIARPLHAEVAALLAVEGGEPARMADHWLAAGQPLHAAPLLVRAAVHAAGLGRLREAAGLAERGADILQRHGRRREAFDAWLRAADFYSGVEDMAGMARCEAALAALADDEGQQAALACVALFRLVNNRQFEPARQLAQTALAQARRAGVAEIEVELLWDLVVLAWNDGSERAATEYAESALARLDAVDPATARLDPATRRFQITEALGLIASGSGRMAQGRLRIAQSFDLARQVGRTKSALSAATVMATLSLACGDAEATRLWHGRCVDARAELDDDDTVAQWWLAQTSMQVLAPLGALGEALAAAERAAAFIEQHPWVESVLTELVRLQLHHELGRPDLALKGARALAARTDLQPPERARHTALLLALGEPADGRALLEPWRPGGNLKQRAQLLCQALPGLPASEALPLLTQAAADAMAQEAHGLWLMLQAGRLAVLRSLGAPAPEAQTLALALWARQQQGLVAPAMFPVIAAQVCATLAPSHPDIAQTIALRAGAWMLNAAATLPPAWRQNFLTRAPLLQALPPRERGLLFGHAA
jgi:DNA-binding SARP family transcriptional activator